MQLNTFLSTYKMMKFLPSFPISWCLIYWYFFWNQTLKILFVSNFFFNVSLINLFIQLWLFHSSETTLIQVDHDLYLAKFSGKVPVVAILDQSVAFKRERYSFSTWIFYTDLAFRIHHTLDFSTAPNIISSNSLLLFVLLLITHLMVECPRA